MKFLLLRTMVSIACAAGLIPCAVLNAKAADEYPTRTIRIIVPVPPGGSVDAMGRIVADKLRQQWTQPVVVENRPGASNMIGTDAVVAAPPDGYTLLFGPGSTMVINSILYPNRPLNPETLEPVSRVATNPTLLVVNPKVPAKTLQEFIAYAKTNPDKLNYATAGDGGVPHLAAQMFMKKSGVRMTKVPYRGVALAMTDLVAGQVDVIFVDISTAIEHVRSDRLRVLGVAADKRNPVLPDVPALIELFPDLISETWFALSAPPKTPSQTVARISDAVAAAVKVPDVQRRMREMGEIEPVGSTPAEMASFMRIEKVRWADLIRDLKIERD